MHRTGTPKHSLVVHFFDAMSRESNTTVRAAGIKDVLCCAVISQEKNAPFGVLNTLALGWHSLPLVHSDGY
jgi:hypothetical protein